MKSKLVVFLIKICILFLIWYIFNEILRETRFWQAVNSLVLRNVLFFSKGLLNLLSNFMDLTVLSYASNGVKGAPHDMLVFYNGDINYNNYNELFISNRCLGLELMFTYSAFIIAFWGPWKQKLWYIPLGIIVINFLNVLRVIGLVFTIIYAPKYMNFNHHLLFTYIIYLFTFIMWVYWIRKFAKDDIIKIVEEIKLKDSLKNKK